MVDHVEFVGAVFCSEVEAFIGREKCGIYWKGESREGDRYVKFHAGGRKGSYALAQQELLF